MKLKRLVPYLNESVKAGSKNTLKCCCRYEYNAVYGEQNSVIFAHEDLKFLELFSFFLLTCMACNFKDMLSGKFLCHQ